MVEVFAFSINALNNMDYLLTYVTKERREKLKRYRFQEDYLRSLLGEIFIRMKAAKYIGVDISEIDIGYNKFGKPHIVGANNFEYNISHSGDWVICAISNKYIGIDIEKIGKAHLDVAERFFTKDEYKILCEVEKGRVDETFFKLWTMKESYVKWLGGGLSIPLNTFSFIKNDDYFYVDENKSIRVYIPSFESGYLLAICTTDEYNNAVQIIDIKELTKELIYHERITVGQPITKRIVNI